MTPQVSAIVVTHRSSAEATRCVESLRRAFADEAVAGEVILVDCGSGPEEMPALASLAADRRLFLEENRGYSGGANAGLAAARAPRLVVCNADVVFLPGALTRLLDALEDSAVGVAAPLCLWDSEGRLKLPSGFAPSFSGDLAQILAGRQAVFDDRRFARFAREAVRLWEKGGRARHLAGAVLAARRDVFDAAGRFDERFLFEYEETEWEDRVRDAGFDLLFVAGARVRHLWAVSASRSSEAGARRRSSESLYRDRRYGRRARLLLERAARLRPPVRPEERLVELSFGAAPGSAVAFSPNRSGIPFAAADLDEDFRFPDEISARLPAGDWRITVFRKSDGRPLGKMTWEKRP